ncbi:peptidylprolyl isomerase [Actinomadura chibensis]|uniref:Peptidyl-prolyl cis-trans isomerase n=1 Tax=Actinomadura chibensis TaxID=392828 RepID=A0A5D0N4Z0_9ACTN|nr:peptidylprolyl isomerase [Actinomadura chibensis]TYB39361.1 peptidylprolyl isomerase [Actinomadura chibensis]
MAGKDRKKELARQRYERQQQRRAEEAARARRLKLVGAAGAVAVVAVGGAVFMVATGKDDESTADGPKCAYKAAPNEGAPKGLGTPPSKPAHTKTVQATVKTNSGDVEMQLYGEKAPCTVESFVYLAQKNFYDKSPCHRLTSGGLNVLQCGDPTGKGTGGPGYQFANENTSGATYTEGTLAMAHSSLPDSNGSQFFMVYKDSQLPPDYTVFGKITKGLDVLKKIADAGSDPKGDGKPKKKVEIQDVTIAGK